MMRRRIRFFMPALAIAAAVALTACGDDGDDEGGGGEATAPAGEPVATVELEESDFKIEPKEPKVDKGGVIRFNIRNTGDAQHALEVETPQGERETEPFGPGETARLDVELEPGTYTMYCPVGDHEQRGMTGTITVGEGGGAQGGADEDEGGEGPSSDAHGGY
jgi:uncharacterized cupredoxin-like copper-binding protein